MPAEHTDTGEFRGAAFRRADLSGATFATVDLSGASFRDADLSGARIVGCRVDGLVVSGADGVLGPVVVDDVDVTGYVSAELDRRYPERVQLRAVRTADDHRALWATVERLWADTIARAGRLPEPLRLTGVDGEWSVTETLRHLAFAVDTWIGRMIRGDERPWARHGLPPTDHPPERTPELGIDLAAEVSFAEAVELHAGRMAQVREVVQQVGDAELAELRTAAPAPVWGIETHSVGACLRVVMREHVEHRRYALRDLAVLGVR